MIGSTQFGVLGLLSTVLSLVFFVWGVSLIWRITRAMERIASTMERRASV